jgi:GNAT superfamily N-acetyltransferase
MFINLPTDKVRAGLVHFKRFFEEYVPTVDAEVNVTGYIVDDEVVGCLIYTPVRIYGVVVSEKHRRQGYGAILINYVKNTTKGILTVYVPPALNPAVALFVTTGFKFEGVFINDDDVKYYTLRNNRFSKKYTSGIGKDIALWSDMLKLTDETIVAHTGNINV